jgi:glycerol kinase
VVRPRVTETTALGAAYLAGLATGVWSGGGEIAAQWAVDRRFEPSCPSRRGASAWPAGARRWRVRAAGRVKAMRHKIRACPGQPSAGSY